MNLRNTFVYERGGLGFNYCNSQPYGQMLMLVQCSVPPDVSGVKKNRYIDLLRLYF